MKHPAPLINSLVDGARMDLRFKLAQQLLLAPGFLHNVKPETTDPRYAPGSTGGNTGPVTPGIAALLAMNTAEMLYGLAVEAGWLLPLDDSTDPLPGGELRAVERANEAQVHGQMHGQKFAQAAQENTMRVARSFPGMNS